mmetsp:Transcript_123903/g.214799  ORF Transcript_123903/g.214799 Transcript_123903/m.214799 type:complete len:85 (-) Transcript_123903:242-496(-)
MPSGPTWSSSMGDLTSQGSTQCGSVALAPLNCSVAQRQTALWPTVCASDDRQPQRSSASAAQALMEEPTAWPSRQGQSQFVATV